MNRLSPRPLPTTRECRSALAPPRRAAANPDGASSVHLHRICAPAPEPDWGTQSGANVPRHLATSSGIVPGERHIGRCPATSGDRMKLIWEQEAAGSNPAIPTRFFECVVSLCKQAATRRQLSLDARRGWVAVHVGCPVAPRCRGTRPRPADRTSVHPIAAGRPRLGAWHNKCASACSNQRAERRHLSADELRLRDRAFLAVKRNRRCCVCAWSCVGSYVFAGPRRSVAQPHFRRLGAPNDAPMPRQGASRLFLLVSF